MSAYKKITCSFKNKNILIDCLKNVDYSPAVYEEKHNLYGYRGDVRDEMAEIIVPKNQISKASNDLGFAYDEEKDEYHMICSDYDLSIGVGDKVKQSYAITALKSALKKYKFNISSEIKNKTVTINANKII